MVQHVSLPSSSTRATIDGASVMRSDVTAPQAAHSYSNDNTQEADGGILAQLNGQSITVRPCPVSIYDKPVTLTPLRMIVRSQLPLSFLDSRNDGGFTFPSTRLFTGRIDILQTASNATQNQVLIVNVVGQSALWAVEGVGQHTFALCKLGDWVIVEHFDEQRVGCDALLRHKIQSTPQIVSDAWWGAAAVKRKSDVLATQSSGHVKRLKLSLLKQSKAEIQPEAACEPAIQASAEEQPVVQALSGQTGLAIEDQLHTPSAEEVLDTLVRQYLEALYTTRASLAFFAKAPLSRARAAFSTHNLDCTISDLALFLRSMIMKIDQMGKKYRETLPEFIKQLPAAAASDDEGGRPAKKRSRKVKKPKLSKSGVYGFEEGFIRRWWFGAASNVETVDNNESAEKRLKRQLAELQTRETLAQIILILEVLAIEASLEKSIPATVDDSQAIEGAAAARPPLVRANSKKPQDLPTLLELLMDKLSIWQSVEAASDFGLDGDDKKDKEGTAKPIDRNGLATFCTEVVIPFYKARLPKQASLINQKLGGTSKSSSSSRPSLGRRKSSKLGETTARSSKAFSGSRPSKPSSLQKQVSDTHLLSRHRCLTRSATDSLLDPAPLPRLKRESSEISMSSIPLNEKSARASREPSVHLRHLNRRQIDLNAIAAATDAKIKAKAEADNELRNAIDALKKPNRVLANREYADETDLRKQSAAAMKRPNALRRASSKKSGVQVGATPSHVRTADFLAKCVVEGSAATDVGSTSPFDRVPMSTPAVPNSISKSMVRPALATTKGPSGFSQPVFSSRSEEVISATPPRGSAGRHADFLSQPATLKSANANSKSKAEALMDRAMNRPVFAIPSSTKKPTAIMAMPTPYLYEEDIDTVAATPSAGPSSMVDYFSTPSKRARTVRPLQVEVSRAAVPDSPMKVVEGFAREDQTGSGALSTTSLTSRKPIASAASDNQKMQKTVVTNGDVANGASIYDALGWDDGDELGF